MAAEEMDKPEEKDSSDFHETEYYSRFQDQDGSLSEEKPEADVSDEIDEQTIQQLMDEALRGTKKPDPVDKPVAGGGGLDTSIDDDWTGGAEVPRKPPPGPAKPKSPTVPPAGLARRTSKAKAFPVLGQRGKGQVRHRRFTWKRTLRFLRVLLFALIVVGGTVAVVIWETVPFDKDTPDQKLRLASGHHEAGRFEAAIEEYEALLALEDGVGPEMEARLLFLQAGAHEQLWKSGTNAQAHFDRAMSRFERAIEKDRTELRIYAVESLLARSEMLLARARMTDPPEEALERESLSNLTALLEEKRYRDNPAVQQGEPHRRMARLIREEDPDRAVELLIQARDSQKDFEEGLENLAIAKIYLDLLNDPAQAEDFFELVNQNELASVENRRIAERELREIGESGLGNKRFLVPETLESLPELMREP